MHRAAVCDQPDAAYPVEQQRTQQPEHLRVSVKGLARGAVDVQREHEYGEIAARAAERLDQMQIVDRIVASAGAVTPLLQQRMQFRVALDHREAQEQEHRESEQPERQGRPDRDGAGNDAHRVQRGEHDHVEHRDTFDAERVAQSEQVIAEQDERESRPDEACECEREDRQQRRGDEARCQRQRAGRERAQTLARVIAVGFEIEHVVEQVYARCAETEADEREYGLSVRARIEHTVRGE